MMNKPQKADTRLTGAGIICGLEVSRHGDACVIIQAGYGLSSDGAWLEHPKTAEYFYYRALKNEGKDTAIYGYFKNPLHIYELLQTHQCGPETPDFAWILKQSESDEDYLYLNDKIIVLYEDEIGAKRMLAFHREDAARFLYGEIEWNHIDGGMSQKAEDFSLFNHARPVQTAEQISNYSLYNHLHPLMSLPVLRIKRFGYADIEVENLPCDENYENNICKIKDFIKDFIKFRLEYQKLTDTAFGQLDAAITYLHTHAPGYLHAEEKNILRQQFDSLCRRWEQYKTLPELSWKDTKGNADPDQSGIQYWYDLLRDLFDAWNELRQAVLQYNAACFPDQNAFPRHLVLGGLPEEREPFYHDPFRTEFHRPPFAGGQNEQARRVRFLHWRMVMMMKSFFVPGTYWDDTAPDTYLTPTSSINADNPAGIQSYQPIRLTPSRSPDQWLGRRAIPVYYDLADHPQSLHWYWDYDAAFQNRADSIGSYHADNDPEAMKRTHGHLYAGSEADAYTQRSEAIHPFIFDMRGMNFVRVEGLVGKEYSSLPTKDILVALKKKYNICFDVEIVELTGDESLCKVRKSTTKRRAIEHLGGVYQGSTLTLVVAKKENGSPDAYKIVGDFNSRICNSK